MRGATTWRRNLGSLLAACVLSLFVLIPAVASATCVCDERPTSAHQTILANQDHQTTPCKAACCLGGHCHHGGAALDAPAVTLTTLARETADHIVTPAPELVSQSPSPLDQPPRG